MFGKNKFSQNVWFNEIKTKYSISSNNINEIEVINHSYCSEEIIFLNQKSKRIDCLSNLNLKVFITYSIIAIAI